MPHTRPGTLLPPGCSVEKNAQWAKYQTRATTPMSRQGNSQVLCCLESFQLLGGSNRSTGTSSKRGHRGSVNPAEEGCKTPTWQRQPDRAMDCAIERMAVR